MIKLIDASVASAENSSVAYITTPRRRETKEVMCVALLTSTGTVTLQGRMHADDIWHTLDSFTSTERVLVPLMPQMRTTLADNVGTVDLWLDV